MPDFSDPCALLAWLGTSPGVYGVVGLVLSVVLEQWPTWGRFNFLQKRILIFLFSLLIPMCALLAKLVICGLVITSFGEFCTHIYLATIAGGSAFISSQAAHTVMNRNS